MIKVKNNRLKLIGLLAILLFMGAFFAPLFSSDMTVYADSDTQYFSTSAGWGVDNECNLTGTAPTEKWTDQILSSINWDGYPDNVTIRIADGTGEREIELNWDENGYFIISSEIEFAIFSCIQGDAIITKNLDMSEFIWTPIDNFHNETLDGGNFTVSGIYVDDNKSTNTGLFSTFFDATIKNLNINQSYIKGTYNVGGIVGTGNKSPETIENCTFDGVVIGENCVGGIAGVLYESTINNCFSYGFVIGNYHEYSTWTVCLGGLVGDCVRSTVKNSGNFSLVNFYTTDLDSIQIAAVGGIIGSVGDYSSVYNCFNRGDIVSGALYHISLCVGGLLGEMRTWANIINCYNTGDIRLEDASLSDGVVVSGLVGNSDFSENANLLNCYTAGDVVINLPNATVGQGLITGFALDYGGDPGIQYCYALEIEELEFNGFAGDQEPSNCGSFDNSQELVRLYNVLNDEIEMGDDLLSLLNDKPTELFASYNLESDWKLSSGDIKPWRADSANVNKGFPVFEETRSLTLETNGGTFESSYTPPASYTEGESVTLPTSDNISRSGYNFLGWTETNETSDITYITTLHQTATGSKTFYAKWNPITYTITYVLDGGTNHADNPGTYTVDENETITLETPTKEGYTLYYWAPNNTIPNGSTGNKTFTAHWRGVDYSVTFNGNGADDGQSMNNQGFTYGTAANLSENLYTKTGHNFVGWATSPDGEVVYTDEQSVSNLTIDVETAFTLYAVWQAEDYTISFNTNGGSEVANITRGYGTLVSAPSQPEKTGWTFKGWFTDDDTFENETSFPFNMPEDGLQLHAKWQINQYTISFNSNNGSIVNSITQDYGTPVTSPGNPTREGYTFMGWFSDENLTTAYTFSTIPAVNITLYAKWEIINYTVTYNLSDGNNHAGNPASYTIESENISLQEPTKTDCVFIGWTFDGQDTPIKIVTVEQGSTGNKTFTANFNVIRLQSNEDLDDNQVSAEIELPTGVEEGVILVVTAKEISGLSPDFSVPKDKKLFNAYNAKLMKNDVEIFPDGTMAIKMLLPNELKDKNNIQVLVWDATTNQTVTKTVIIDGEHISFETSVLGDFVFVADAEPSSNLLVLWLILGISSGLLVLFLLWVFLYKRKVTFILNGEKVGDARYKKGEALNFPSNLAKYKWFSDKEQTKLFTKQKMGWFSFTLYRNSKS